MSYQISDLVTLLNGIVKGESVEQVSGLAPFFHAEEDEISFAAEEKFLTKLGECKAKVIIVPDIELPMNLGKMYIVVRDNPRILMPKLLHFFKRPLKKMEKMIEDSAKIGKNVSIAPNVYIGHDVVIGDNVVLYPHVFIGEGAVIGEGSILYSNVSIREFVKVGRECIFQSGAVIGSDGFGFVKVQGNNMKIEQIGSVVIEDFVEIGANTTVDRGTIGNTLIKKYTKIDNLVQVAHNDRIGENCLIVSQVGIAGSTEIGNNVTLAGQTGVAGHIKIGDNIVIGSKSGVSGDVKSNQILSGYPLVDHKEDLKIKVSMKKLPELLKRVKALENKGK